MADEKLTEGEQELLGITTKCVKIAKEAWWSEFSNSDHSYGESVRQAVGRLANTLLEHQLAQRLPVKL